jgi:outer membrane protein assembly factor BamB
MSALAVALVAAVPVAEAKITSPVTLEQLVKDQPLIFTARVTEFLPDKPGMVLVPVDKLRGDFPFERVPVNLKGDKEAIKEKQPDILLERLDKDLPLLIFAARDGRVFDAVAYTNGTWIRLAGVVEKDGDKEVTRWQFLHCETYFRRTYKGTTDELLKAVQGGLKGEKLPPYNAKEEPGYGPPLKTAKDTKEPLAQLGTRVPLGVIQLPFLGLIAALAALFPALFGGMAVFMRRWVAALSVAGIISILAALVVYFPNWIDWSGITSVSTMWLVGAGLAVLGALWAAYRYRRAVRAGKGDEFQPRYADRVGLIAVVLAAAGALTYAVVSKQPLGESPWLELILFSAPAAACLYFVLAHWIRSGPEPQPVSVSGETVGLWAGAFACAIAGVTLMSSPRGPAVVSGGGTGRVKLVEQPLWVFEPKKKGEILSTPCVTPERVYVTVHHRPNPIQQFGTVYALDPNTGATIWEFDTDPDDVVRRLKPMFSSPVYADGKLYFGEGYHMDQDSRLFCLDAATGKMLWAFETNSHTESTPAVADGKVVFGAGDDGLMCLDAVTGKQIWQFTAEGGLHVDSNPLIHNGRVYAGSGTSKRSKNTRIFCVDLKTGKEVWGEKVEYSAWGSPNAAGRQVFFATGNGTLSEDRDPVAGLLLCRDAATGQPLWERALPNSLVGKPAVDRYQVYVGCKDGNLYALDRQTGEPIWSKGLQGPVLSAPAIDVNPRLRTGEILYGIGSSGVLEAMSPVDGAVHWAISFRDLIEVAHVNSISTPVIVRELAADKRARRVYIALGFGPSAVATPTARLYCFRDVSE